MKAVDVDDCLSILFPTLCSPEMPVAPSPSIAYLIRILARQMFLASQLGRRWTIF